MGSPRPGVTPEVSRSPLGHLWVPSEHPGHLGSVLVTLGVPWSPLGHSRVTLGSPLGHLWVTPGCPEPLPSLSLSLSGRGQPRGLPPNSALSPPPPPPLPLTAPPPVSSSRSPRRKRRRPSPPGCTLSCRRSAAPPGAAGRRRQGSASSARAAISTVPDTGTGPGAPGAAMTAPPLPASRPRGAPANRIPSGGAEGNAPERSGVPEEERSDLATPTPRPAVIDSRSLRLCPRQPIRAPSAPEVGGAVTLR